MADRPTGLFVPKQGIELPEPPSGMEAVEAATQPRRWRMSRGLALRWLAWGTILALLGQWLAGFGLGFFWPRKVGAFGGQVPAGALAELKVGEVKMVREGKFYLSRVSEGVLALWWKCPHLGCTIPWRPDDPSMDEMAAKGRFNCPCHGSIYDRYGQIITGPAPRPMDLFPTEVRDGTIFVQTGPTVAVQRAKAIHGPPHVTPV